MFRFERAAALRCGRRAAISAATVMAILSAGSASALTQSWNGYRWARATTLEIVLGDNVGAAWDPYLRTAVTGWSAANHINLVLQAGLSNPSAPRTCASGYGTVQICAANYGATGWLGYTNVYTSGGLITRATVKLNDYYFAQTRYNTVAWRQLSMCHEIGHSLGLDHADSSNSNANIGSCLDLTAKPGGDSNNLSNVAPGRNDFAALDGIYANANLTQLAQTQPQQRIAYGLGIDGTELGVTVTAIPEPGTWALMLVGFGVVGAARRRHPAGVAA